uniref:Reverse transcriptase/retrotransposon-derived protein RNase H-like domain-containing protein n=1 Tax=Cajanus cajan TaxID=3821 RepID=A0A151SM59_CAJCA|nr:hypothetical protein KK1_002123 [Cajanus cajan]
MVLQLLQENKLYAKLSKCSFGQPQVEYLGHMISGNYIYIEASKIQVILAWPIPTNLKQLWGFLRLTCYYRRFIKGYAALVGPLTELLKKDNFHWQDEASLAFAKLKKALTQAPILALPDFALPFQLETDVSGLGIGAILS